MLNYPMTLEQYIGQTALREIELVRMGAQIAGALAVIHQQRKIHGDVRPANILVLGDGNYQLIGMDAIRQYPQGNIPAFIAPELEQGAAYSPAIDIYALGMMMKALEPRREGVSEVLREMIQKACEPDPANRYETALEFANELEMMYEVLAQTYGQPQPVQNMAQSQPVQPQTYRQPRPAQPQAVKQPQSKGTQKEQDASLALRFILPILIVLVVAAAVVAYAVLIRPSLNDKKETTVERETVEATTGETTTEASSEEAKTCIVPDTAGMEEESAKAQLEELNLTVAVKYETSDTVEEGLVVSQSILSGTTVAEQTEIILTVSEGNGCPYEYSQKVVVSANAGSTNGTLTVYNWENGDWVSKFSCACVIGKNGIGSDYGEGKGVTPLGTFKLGFVLGTRDPNNGMVFKQASSTTAIVDDTNSSLYNTLVDTSQVDGISVDHVGDNIVSGKLSCVIFIEHNGNGLTTEGVVSGKGSVITICGNNQDISATAGCIDIKASDMSTLLTYLDGTKNPHIETKVE